MSDDKDTLLDDGLYDQLSSSPSIHEEEIDFHYVYALKNFVATEQGQANAQKGDAMILLNDANSYWWLVRLVRDASVGFLPAEHIETPSERLARLNKHRNGEICILSRESSGASRHRLKGRRKRSIKKRKVEFVPHVTYVSASEYYTEDDDGDEGDDDVEDDDDDSVNYHGDKESDGEEEGANGFYGGIDERPKVNNVESNYTKENLQTTDNVDDSSFSDDDDGAISSPILQIEKIRPSPQVSSALQDYKGDRTEGSPQISQPLHINGKSPQLSPQHQQHQPYQQSQQSQQQHPRQVSLDSSSSGDVLNPLPEKKANGFFAFVKKARASSNMSIQGEDLGAAVLLQDKGLHSESPQRRQQPNPQHPFEESSEDEYANVPVIPRHKVPSAEDKTVKRRSFLRAKSSIEQFSTARKKMNASTTDTNTTRDPVPSLVVSPSQGSSSPSAFSKLFKRKKGKGNNSALSPTFATSASPNDLGGQRPRGSSDLDINARADFSNKEMMNTTTNYPRERASMQQRPMSTPVDPREQVERRSLLANSSGSNRNSVAVSSPYSSGLGSDTRSIYGSKNHLSGMISQLSTPRSSGVAGPRDLPSTGSRTSLQSMASDPLHSGSMIPSYYEDDMSQRSNSIIQQSNPQHALSQDAINQFDDYNDTDYLGADTQYEDPENLAHENNSTSTITKRSSAGIDVSPNNLPQESTIVSEEQGHSNKGLDRDLEVLEQEIPSSSSGLSQNAPSGDSEYSGGVGLAPLLTSSTISLPSSNSAYSNEYSQSAAPSVDGSTIFTNIADYDQHAAMYYGMDKKRLSPLQEIPAKSPSREQLMTSHIKAQTGSQQPQHQSQQPHLSNGFKSDYEPLNVKELHPDIGPIFKDTSDRLGELCNRLDSILQGYK